MAQKVPQPLEDEAEVVADGAHDGVDPIAETALEEVSVRMTVGREGNVLRLHRGIDGDPGQIALLQGADALPPMARAGRTPRR